MWRFAVGWILILALTGCGANFTTAFRTYRPVDGAANVALIDAKQRAILAVQVPGESDDTGGAQGSATQATATTQAPDETDFPRSTLFCAEPSPDALSAISSSLSASFGGLFPSGVQVQAALAQALSETASQLGVRNATIQLLRDGLYRQCEAYMNGLIDRPYYEQIANKYVNAMVALLAIEQLAPVGASATTIRASDGGKVTTETNVNLTAKSPIVGKKDEQKKDEEKKPSSDGADSDKKIETPTGEAQPSGETAADTTTTEKVEVDTSKDSADESGGTSEQSGSSSSSGEAAPPVASVNLPSPNQRETSPHVAKAVSAMVTWFLTKDTVDYCLRQLFTLDDASAHASGSGNSVSATGTISTVVDTPFVETCKTVIAQQSKQQGEYLTAVAEDFGTNAGPMDDCSTALESFWMPGGLASTANQKAIKDAMKNNKVSAETITDLVNARQFAHERSVVGQALGLPSCK